MKDRFKFRFFDKVLKEMCYPTEYNGKAEYLERRYDLADMFRFKDLIPMQSTGLKDRNGKLIFEGDIIEWKKENHIVIFDERNATFGIKISDVETHLFNDIHTPTRWIEVIGNIYENKELLGEQ